MEICEIPMHLSCEQSCCIQSVKLYAAQYKEGLSHRLQRGRCPRAVQHTTRTSKHGTAREEEHQPARESVREVQTVLESWIRIKRSSLGDVNKKY